MADEPQKKVTSQEQKPQEVRDKDNAAPRLKPSYSKHPRPNLAPSGMMGIQKGSVTHKQDSIQKSEPNLLSIMQDHPQPHFLTDGHFPDNQGHSFVVQIENYRTPLGIEGGKISQLEIQDQGRIVAQFTEGQWTKKPENVEQLEMAQQLQDLFGERPKEFNPIVVNVIDKDFGHEH